MKARITTIVSIVTLLVIALSGSVVTAAAQSSSSSSSPSVATISIFIPVVDKSGLVKASTSSATLDPSSATSASPATSTTSYSYAPQPGDKLLQRDKVFIDYTRSHLIVTGSATQTVDAYLVGNLPDPCHLLRITQSSITSTNTINILVYSLVRPGTACIAVLKPFAVTYPVGNFAAGTFTVLVNGKPISTSAATPASASGTK